MLSRQTMTATIAITGVGVSPVSISITLTAMIADKQYPEIATRMALHRILGELAITRHVLYAEEKPPIRYFLIPAITGR